MGAAPPLGRSALALIEVDLRSGVRLGGTLTPRNMRCVGAPIEGGRLVEVERGLAVEGEVIR